MKQFFINLITSKSGVSSKRFAGLFLVMSPFVLTLFCLIFVETVPEGLWYFLGTEVTSGCGLLGYTAWVERKDNK